jgi:hypothetical protein
MLKFAKSVAYLPDPARSRPFISEADKVKATSDPPAAVPFHCKPWVDGQTVGWTLFYGYLTSITIVGTADGKIEVRNLEQLARETSQPRIVDQFADGHFGIGTGYTLQTPPGMVSLILPATHAPSGLNALTGVVETDWYPRQLFAVFAVPSPGTEIILDYQMPLVRVVVIPRHEGWEVRPLNETELANLAERNAAYLKEEVATDTRWTAVSGDTFTHLYKQKSSQYRKR